MFYVVIYEMKQQYRTLGFRLFALFSLLSILLCHIYWQGQGNCENWKMVALPCAMPLVNAYLFNVIQSLFLILIVSVIPLRMRQSGASDAIKTRSYDNVSYYWGVIIGNFLLFLILNVVEVLVSVFVVNLTSLAPVGWRYYIFYLLTLNIPVWVFVAGVTLWLSYATKFRFWAVTISVIWWFGGIFYLPYWQHGTWDYLASGVPNVFSEVTGHVDLWRYLIHRLLYFFVGMGLLVCGVSWVERLPNRVDVLKKNVLWGVMLVVMGVGCGVALEYVYYRDLQIRLEYRECFARNWSEKTCRVKSHAITLAQSGERLTLHSEMIVYNPGHESIEKIYFFLNPGLRVKQIVVGKDRLSYTRDEQVIVINQGLGVGDSLQMCLEYEGEIDERICDLHLPKEEYENTFYGDRFFARGRRGAFVSDEFLLLSPASIWYPVAVPPVNPLSPSFTGRDFTRFRLAVVQSQQNVLYSQGNVKKMKDTMLFVPSRELTGISLCGGNFNRYHLNIEGIEVEFLSLGGYDILLRRFAKVDDRLLMRILHQPLFQLDDFGLLLSKRWCEKGASRLCFLETPLAFRLESHEGKTEQGQVEPGMVFIPERGFDMDIADIVESEGRSKEELSSICAVLQANLRDPTCKVRNSHPLLGIGTGIDSEHYTNVYNYYSLLSDDDIWVSSSKYPFMGKVFDRLRAGGFSRADLKREGNNKRNREYDYLTGSTLSEALENSSAGEAFLSRVLDLGIADLWDRLTWQISARAFEVMLDTIFSGYDGEVDYDSICGDIKATSGVDVHRVMEEWVSAKHKQFFKIKDVVAYYYSEKGLYEIVGKIENIGEEGGIVSVECGSFLNSRRYCHFLNAGEAKEFKIVTDVNPVSVKTSLSANRPPYFNIAYATGIEDKELVLGNTWEDISSSEFESDANEIVVDDAGVGFKIEDDRMTLVQKWIKRESLFREEFKMVNAEVPYWTSVIDVNAHGDSIRSFHCKSGGVGRSKAIWSITLPETGKYNVMAKVYRGSLLSSTFQKPEGVVYYYTVVCNGKEISVEVNLDEVLESEDMFTGWISLGEHYFSAGEASVILSDKEVQHRKEVAIVADAVKWVKLE